MSDQNVRSFSVNQGSVLDGEFTLRVKPEMFPEASDQSSSGKPKSDRKFNIRIKQHDVLLFDALAEQEGVSRSVLINRLLHDFLRDELMSVQDDDARALLAVTADKQASYDDLAQSWVLDALGSDFHHILRNILEFNDRNEQQPSDHPGAPENQFNSEAFIGLRNKLKGIKK
jgi:hypothetical protein